MTAPATPAQVAEIKRLVEAAIQPWHVNMPNATNDFVAACRTTVPALIALIEAQAAEIANARMRIQALSQSLEKWSKAGEIRLAMGEITASEMRCVKAAVGAISRQFEMHCSSDFLRTGEA